MNASWQPEGKLRGENWTLAGRWGAQQRRFTGQAISWRWWTASSGLPLNAHTLATLARAPPERVVTVARMHMEGAGIPCPTRGPSCGAARLCGRLLALTRWETTSAWQRLHHGYGL